EIPQHRLYFHEYAPPDKIGHRVRQVFDWLNGPEPKKLKDPVRVAARVHFDLLRVFPFSQDSGKVCRLLMNLLLMRADLPPVIIHSTARQRYSDALKGSLPTIGAMVSDSMRHALASIEMLLDEEEARLQSLGELPEELPPLPPLPPRTTDLEAASADEGSTDDDTADEGSAEKSSADEGRAEASSADDDTAGEGRAADESADDGSQASKSDEATDGVGPNASAEESSEDAPRSEQDDTSEEAERSPEPSSAPPTAPLGATGAEDDVDRDDRPDSDAPTPSDAPDEDADEGYKGSAGEDYEAY